MGKILYELFSGQVLPGFESPYSNGFDLSVKKGGEIYAYINLLLEGMLNDNPSIRLDSWGNIETEIQTLKNTLLPREEGVKDIEEIRKRLIVVSDELHRGNFKDGKEKAYDIEEIKKRCQEMRNSIIDHWEQNEYVKLVRDVFIPKNPRVAEFNINKNENFFETLGGPYVHSREGRQPLEDSGRVSKLEVIQEGKIGIVAKSNVKIDSLWLGCSVFNQEEKIRVVLMILKKECEQPNYIDIVRETIMVHTGSMYEVRLEQEVFGSLETLAKRWCEEITIAVEKIG